MLVSGRTKQGVYLGSDRDNVQYAHAEIEKKIIANIGVDDNYANR